MMLDTAAREWRAEGCEDRLLAKRSSSDVLKHERTSRENCGTGGGVQAEGANGISAKESHNRVGA